MTRTIPERQQPQPDWAELSRALSRFALSLCSDRHEADELAQQTIARLLARRPDRADHLGLARTTLTRLWLDKQRSLRRRMTRLRRLAESWREGVIPRDGAAAGEDLARAKGALERLPPRQRAALVLRVVEELEYATIAEILGCDVGAVRSNLHLARRALRRAVGEEQ